MATQTIELQVVTPSGLALEAQTSEVTLPSAVGEIGVLPLHTRYTGLLGTGLVQYMDLDSRQPKRFVVSGGFIQVSDNKLTILADSIDFPEKIDRENYASDREELKVVVEKGNTLDPSFEHAQKDLARIEAIDRLISH